jgi:cytoskeletal protein RodZ
MTAENNSLSFGRYLKNVRLEKGISLEAVSSETKIGLNTLLFIENEELNRLPAEVFVKGFLRAYANAIGTDGNEAIRRYVVDLDAFKESKKFEADLFKATSRFWPRLLFSLGLLSSIIALSVYLLYRPQTQGLPGNGTNQHQHAKTRQQSVLEVSEPALTNQPFPPILSLKVLAVKKTWMKVVIDGQNTQKYRLHPGDRLELRAESGFNLLVGDAKGVRLTLGDTPQRIPGNEGQMVTIQIP